MVNKSPRIRTCLRAKALQRAGVNFPCTTAAFTLPPEPAGFVVLCQLAQGLSLVCGFCSPDQVRGRLGSKRCAEVHPGPLAGLPSDGRSPSRPCLRLVLLVVFINMNTLGSRTGDFHPISSRPCRAYTSRWNTTRRGAARFTGSVGHISMSPHGLSTTWPLR